MSRNCINSNAYDNIKKLNLQLKKFSLVLVERSIENRKVRLKMAKIRVHELAKKMDITSKKLLAKLAGLGVEVKGHTSSVDEKIDKKLLAAPAKKKKPKSESKPSARKTKEKPKTPRVLKKTAKKVKKTVTEKVSKPVEVKEIKKKIEETKSPAEPLGETLKEALPIEAERITKFKSKPGMQRAFDTIKRVDISKKWFGFKPGYKKHERKSSVLKTGAAVISLPTLPRKRVLKFSEGTTVKEFSELIGLKLPEVIRKFMELGYMPTINQPVDADAAQIIAESFGLKIELTHVETEEDLLEEAEVDVSALSHRPPIVTIMGHVDHGKTTLLDAIRQTKVTDTEAGGITQHIGAYKIKLKDKEIVFLDTPGHEAFTMMRARGAKVTDIVVLVVAADDSVMPQTVEAIDHAKAANVPIVVAINKIDKPGANVTKVRNELSQQEVVSEDWGGQSVFVEVSAKQKTGIENLLEMILLQAEMMELKADYDRPAKGTIIEAKLDKGKGPVGTILVQSGTLKIGDTFLAGTLAGKVRALIDDNGHRIEKVGPSTPVEVIGFPNVPQAGDIFIVMGDEKKARQIAMNRLQKQKTVVAAKTSKITLTDLYEKIKEGTIKELNTIIKADVGGTMEAVKDSFERISHPEVKVKVIHSSVGGINESDVMLATASNAIIIGFNVRPEAKAHALAEKEGVDIKLYNVIYEAIEDIKKALEGLLAPTITEKIQGRAEVRQLFHVSKVGTIAGCYVLDGEITRASSGIRVIRDNIVVYDGQIESLKRFKDDAKEVQVGYECGIMIENFNDIKVGDILENYLKEEVATKLE